VLRTQQHGRAEKSGLQDVTKVDFIQSWQRSGLKYQRSGLNNPEKPKISG